MFIDIDSVAMLCYIIFFAVILGATSKSKYFAVLIGLYGVVIAVVCVISVSQSNGINLNLPGGDGVGYYDQAKMLSKYGVERYQDIVRSHYIGYQIYLAVWNILFGVSYQTVLMANATLLLVSIRLFYTATIILGLSIRARYIAVVLFMLSTEYINYLVLLLREPAFALGHTLFLLGIAQIINKKQNMIGAVNILAAVFIFGVMRTTQLFFLGVVLIFVLRFLISRSVFMIIMIMYIVFVIWPLFANFTYYDINTQFLVATVTDNQVLNDAIEYNENVNKMGIVSVINGYYLNLPFAAKVILFFIPSTIQYFIPINFWDPEFIHNHISYFFSRNLKILWLLITGPIFLYVLTSFNRDYNLLIKRFAVGGWILYIIIAIMYGGAVPRYSIPMLLFVYPAMAYFIDQAIEDDSIRTSIMHFYQIYMYVLGACTAIYMIIIMIR